MSSTGEDSTTATMRWRWVSALVIGAAAVVLFGHLGDRALISEEVRWAQISREMRDSGDLFVPTYNGRAYQDKPVGTYWLIVAASSVTGSVSEFSARLPAALAGIVGVWVIILLGRRLYDPETALYAGGLLATSFGFVVFARRATADIETVTGVLVAVWMYERQRGHQAGPWVIALWMWMAAVSLMKGLLGVVLPTAVFALHGAWTVWAQERARGDITAIATALVNGNRWLFNRWTMAAIPLGALVYLFPFMMSAIQTGDRSGLELVWRENVQRFFATHNHAGPVYLYLGVVFVLSAPWSVFLPAALVSPTPMTDGDRLARSYFFAVFLFFTAASSRRSYYLLPITPAVALLVARLLTARSGDLRPLARGLRTAGWLLVGAAVMAAGVVMFEPTVISNITYLQLPPLPVWGRGWLAATWMLAFAVTVFASFKSRFRAGLALAGMFLVFGYGFVIAYPAADDLRTRRPFLTEVRQRTDTHLLGVFHAEDIVFEIGHPLPEFATDQELAAALRSGRVRWVVLPRRWAAAVPDNTRVVAEERFQPWEPPDKLDDKLLLVETVPGQPGARQ